MIEKRVIQLASHLRGIPTARRLARWWVKGRDMRISSGLGAGLWFNSAHSNPAYTLGSNEQPVQTAMCDYLRPGDIFYDIGANVGFFSVIAARIVGPQGQVVAFEPVPENADAIRHNVRLNNFQNVTVLEKAVTNTCGQGELQVTTVSGGATLLSAGIAPDVERVIEIPLTSIDASLREQVCPPPDMVKIDVEGAEMKVLLGMAHTLNCYRPILIYEVDDQNQEAFQQKSFACSSFLTHIGYTICRLQESYPDAGWYVANYLALP